MSSTIVAGISAPVGQACTHSPQATQVEAAHRIVEVEHDLFEMAAAGHADDVVDLDLAAGADAEIALDAGVEIDRHRDMAAVRLRHLDPLALGEAAGLDLLALDDLPELAVRIVRVRRWSGWSVSSSSATILRAVLARSVWVLTFMPGVGVRRQLAASTRSPSISTMQTRQLPSGR